MKRENYGGFVIEARSSELQNNLGWDSMFTLEKHDGQGVTVTTFYLPNPYGSEEEGIAAALAHGRKKIDDGFSPPDSGTQRQAITH
jgi:hypothetical protein